MKKTITLFTAVLTLLAFESFAQTEVKEYTGGNEFKINLPAYMSRAVNLNSAAILQWKSTVKDVYGFVIEDNKEELKIAEMNFGSAKEFYENFIADFLKGQPKRKVGTPLFTEKDGISFVEADVTYYDKDAKTDIYYLVGVVETKEAFYKVLSWCSAENKAKFKADFQKIVYSLKE